MPFPAFFISILSDEENNRSLRTKSQLSADGIEFSLPNAVLWHQQALRSFKVLNSGVNKK